MIKTQVSLQEPTFIPQSLKVPLLLAIHSHGGLCLPQASPAEKAQADMPIGNQVNWIFPRKEESNPDLPPRRLRIQPCSFTWCGDIPATGGP